MADEQDWAAYSDQATLADNDTLLARTAAAAGVEVPGSAFIRKRSDGRGFSYKASGGVSDYQHAFKGQAGGYGAGFSFVSDLLVSGAELEMARIVTDGDDIWSSANATTQRARLTFYTTYNGVLAERMRIEAGGKVLVGSTSATFAEKFGVYNNTSGGAGSVAAFVQADTGNISNLVLKHDRAAGGNQGYQISFQNAANSTVGAVVSSASGTAFVTSSDYRLKDITGPVENSGTFIDALHPVVGSWKVDGSPFVGLIAHEVQTVATTPIAFGEKDDPERMQALDYSSPEMVANIIAELQALRRRAEAAEARLAALEAA